MKISYGEAQGLSLDVLTKVAYQEEYDIEPDMLMDIPDDLFERWKTNYDEAAKISTELYNLYMSRNNG